MPELGVQVRRVVVPVARPHDIEHARAPQVADKAPDGALRKRQAISNLANRAAGMQCYVEEYRAVARYQIPVMIETVAAHGNDASLPLSPSLHDSRLVI